MKIGQSATANLDGIGYHVHHQVVGIIQHDILESRIRPAIVLSTSTGNLDVGHIPELLQTFSRVDDVYSAAFHDSLVIQTAPGTNLDLTGLRTRIGNDDSVKSMFRRILGSYATNVTKLLPSGPYFLQGQNIHQAWRLYPDDLQAFIQTVIPDDIICPSSFFPLQAISQDGVYQTAAVPSRLYSEKSKDKPLSGMRITIKDNMDLAGIKSTMMNRAYTELYGPRTKSAAIVRKLIALGAIIIGKTRMCAFASAEEPTDQWIEYHCPYNPRGDMNQSPSGSTTGGAAALAGYSWLDYSLGTDTTGSIRAPATCCGLYALRSSWGSASLEGIVKQCDLFDVIGIMSRELNTLHYLAKSALVVKEFASFPKRILYPTDFFPHSDPTQQAMVNELVITLENFLGVRKTEFSFAERWSQCPPSVAKGKSLKDFLSKSAFWVNYYDGYHEYDQFRDDYKRNFGKEVYVGPYMRFRWDAGANVTKDERDRGVSEFDVFREWVLENVMKADPAAGSDAILIMPCGNAKPKYRDMPNGAPRVLPTLSENYIASILQLPQLILPVGQNPYQSRVSGREEHRPIAGSIVGAQGSDLMLINLAKAAFESALWHTSISTGRYMFSLGDNVRKVAPATKANEVNSKTV